MADEGSGKSYYYNATTCVTQWDPPPGFVSSAGKAADGGVSGDAAVRQARERVRGVGESERACVRVRSCASEGCGWE